MDRGRPARPRKLCICTIYDQSSKFIRLWNLFSVDILGYLAKYSRFIRYSQQSGMF